MVADATEGEEGSSMMKRAVAEGVRMDTASLVAELDDSTVNDVVKVVDVVSAGWSSVVSSSVSRRIREEYAVYV